MQDTVIEFKNVTKMYKLFKNDKRRLLHTFIKSIKYKILFNTVMSTSIAAQY